MTNFDTDSLQQFNKKIYSASKGTYEYSSFNIKNERIYFAGPWFDDRAKAFYDACLSIVHSYTTNVFVPRDIQLDSPRNTFLTDISEIENCDVVIALIARKDIGTSWELGLAKALKKQIIMVGYDESTFKSKTNIMLAFCGRCITFDKLYKLFTIGLRDDDFVIIDDDWKDKE